MDTEHEGLDISGFSGVDRARSEPLIIFLDVSRASVVIDHPDHRTTARIVASSVEQTADGRAGRGLRRRFVDAGLVEVSVQGQFVANTWPMMTGLLAPSLQALTAAGELTAEHAQRWLDDGAQQWRGGRLSCGALVFIASARRP